MRTLRLFLVGPGAVPCAFLSLLLIRSQLLQGEESAAPGVRVYPSEGYCWFPVMRKQLGDRRSRGRTIDCFLLLAP